MRALTGKLHSEARLVDVVRAAFAELAERLDPDRQTTLLRGRVHAPYRNVILRHAVSLRRPFSGRRGRPRTPVHAKSYAVPFTS